MDSRRHPRDSDATLMDIDAQPLRYIDDIRQWPRTLAGWR